MSNSTILQKGIVFYDYKHKENDVGIGRNPVDYLHYHDMYEINLVLSGQEEVYFANNKRILKETEMCIFRPYEIHKRALDPNIETSQICLAVKKECFEHAIYFLGSSIDTSSIFDVTIPFIKKLHSSDIKFFYEHISNLYDSNVPSGQIKEMSEGELKIIIINILSLCLKLDKKQDFSIPIWLQQLNNDMNILSNCAEGIKALSRLSGKSSSTISHAFKQYLGMTPSKFVNDKRLQNASKLLLTTDNEIVDIAFMCGFGSLSYFYKQFNELYGISPLQYRIKNETQKRGCYEMNNFNN